MAGSEQFRAELAAILGSEPVALGEGRVSFEYAVPVGKFRGTKVGIAIDVPADFPNSPPTGIHVRPRLLPINPSAADHPDRVADSSAGQDWEYWSRRYEGWAESDHSVKSYMAFIRTLFATQ